MPKRTADEMISHYKQKIKKLETKKVKPRKRIIVYSESSDAEDIETNALETRNDLIQLEHNPDGVDQQPPQMESHEEAPVQDTVLPLDPDLLTALGEVLPEQVTYGPDIHPDLAQRWAPILRKGLLDKDQKEKLFRDYVAPNNCKLFRAPTLNPEIAAAVSEFARARDKKIENSQQQLGMGLTAINKAMTVLLTSENKVQTIKYLSDACRLLSDLHSVETQIRTKSLTQGLEKSFLNIVQDCERDETLFGANLSEKIKASKAIEKQGAQIKKPEAKPLAVPSTSRSTRLQGNWKSPARSTKGGRGGSRRTPYMYPKPVPSQNTFTPNRTWNKPPRAGPRT